jgi:SAM-dependent methyltransferase
MDYDATTIPEEYDAGRSIPPERLRLWIETIANHLVGKTLVSILDLGCGTGRFSAALARRFSARVTAVDPSLKMLSRAKAKPSVDVNYLRAEAEALLTSCSHRWCSITSKTPVKRSQNAIASLGPVVFCSFATPRLTLLLHVLMRHSFLACRSSSKRAFP